MKPFPPHISRTGQSLLELALGMSLAITIVLGGIRVFRTEWDRIHCAYLAFERAHSCLLRACRPISSRMKVLDDGTKVSVRAVCGKTRQEVELFHLEPKENLIGDYD